MVEREKVEVKWKARHEQSNATNEELRDDIEKITDKVARLTE